MLLLHVPDGGRVRIELPDGRFVWVTVRGKWGGGLQVAIDAPEDVRIRREKTLPFAEWYAATRPEQPGAGP